MFAVVIVEHTHTQNTLSSPNPLTMRYQRCSRHMCPDPPASTTQCVPQPARGEEPGTYQSSLGRLPGGGGAGAGVQVDTRGPDTWVDLSTYWAWAGRIFGESQGPDGCAYIDSREAGQGRTFSRHQLPAEILYMLSLCGDEETASEP